MQYKYKRPATGEPLYYSYSLPAARQVGKLAYL